MSLSMAQVPAIGFITYNPDPSFYDRVALAVQANWPVFIVDNSPASTDVDRLLRLSDESTKGRARVDSTPSGGALHYMTSGKNAGLGVGLSSLCATAMAHGYRELLFFDQDTRFTSETLSHVRAFSEQRLLALRDSYAAIVFRGPDRRLAANTLHDVMLAISSGMLIVLENARRMGWHNHSYFVDGVDYEFCLNARARGFRIGIFPGTPGFDHETEQPDVPRLFMGRTWRLRKYAARRVLDSLSAYLRLSIRSALQLDAAAFMAITRSASIFLLGQLLARVPLRRAG